MISVRTNEEDLFVVMKIIKKTFSRLVKTYCDEEEYHDCKNNIVSMYSKIREKMNRKYAWNEDFQLYSKASLLLSELENIKYIYEYFIHYRKTPNNLSKFKVEVTLSILLAEELYRFLGREIEFQLLFYKKTVKELSKVISFQDDLQRSIRLYRDTSILVSIKADEYNSFEKIDEKYKTGEFKEENVIEDVDTSNSHFADESALHKLGYKITGLSRTQRWNILANKAIPQLGLDKTVQIISGLIETRKLQKDGEIKYAYAIKEWNHDISKLADYYLLK